MKKSLLPIVFGLSLAFPHCQVNSSSSDLDTTFGSNGKITIDFASGEDGATGLALQSNGAIIVVGRAYSGTTSDFAVARLSEAGALDVTFGGDGKVTTDFGGNDEAHAVAVQTDGKIVVAGTTTSGGTTQIAVARYKADGSLDTTFNADGKVYVLIGTVDDATAIAIDDEGKIVLGGTTYNGSNKDFMIVRLESDGDLDTTFSADGKLGIAIGTGDDVGRGVALQSDGKIIVAGSAKSGTENDFGITRVTTAGVLDTTFGTSGKATVNFLASPSNSEDNAYGVQVLSGGNIVVGGTSNNGTNDLLALARLTSAGAMDSTFGSNGIATLGYANSQGEAFNVQGLAMTLSTGNQPILAGFVHPETGFDIGLAQFQNDGTKDIGFGTDGIVSTDIAGQTDEAHAVKTQTNGKIVVAGRAFNGADFDFVVLRYQ